MNSDLIAYASQYVAYLINNLDTVKHKIKEIILFGSVARGEASKSSDIDLFINLGKEDKVVAKSVLNLTRKFYTTEFFRLWKNLGVEHEIKPIIGDLSAWKLRSSIIAEGILLFGKYSAPFKEGRPHTIIYWDRILNQSKRVLLSKRLYGYSYQRKSYGGVLGQGMKLGANCIMVPIETSKEIEDMFKRLGLPFRIIFVGKM